MEKSRRKIRICLVCIVLTAIVIGLFYYYYEMQGNAAVNEGTLIASVRTGLDKLWR